MSVGELCSPPALSPGEGACGAASSGAAVAPHEPEVHAARASVPQSPADFMPVIGLDTSRHHQAAVLERTVQAARVRRSDHNRARSVRVRAQSAPANPARPVVPPPVVGLPVSGPYAPRAPWSIALGQSLGHDFMVTAGLVWCRQCAGYLCHFPRLLRAECDHGFPLGRKSAEATLPHSRARTLERLFRGEHPDSGRHIGVPRRIPRVVPLPCPAPNGAVAAQRDFSACVSGGPSVPASLVPASHVRLLPHGSARVPGSLSSAGTAQEVDSTGTSSSAIPPSLLEVSLQRAASVRVAAKATTSVEGRPRNLAPPVLLHPSASLVHDPCLG